MEGWVSRLPVASADSRVPVMNPSQAGRAARALRAWRELNSGRPGSAELTWFPRGWALIVLCFCSASTAALPPPRVATPDAFRVANVLPPGDEGIKLVGKEPLLEITAAFLRGLTNGFPLTVGDELRTPRASMILLKQRLAVLNLEGESVLTIVGREEAPELWLESGRLWFESRGRRQTLILHTPYGAARFHGTKFHLDVDRDHPGAANLLMLDGEAELLADQGTQPLLPGETGQLRRGLRPRRLGAAELTAPNQVMRWVLYYPAVLDPAELAWPGGSPPVELEASLAAYRAGDLLTALAEYPRNRLPESAAEEVYHAATLLAVGAVDDALVLLDQSRSEGRYGAGGDATAEAGRALRLLINTVLGSPGERGEPDTATGWLAESYYQQAQTGPWQATEPWEVSLYGRGWRKDNIERALVAAERARNAAPAFGFARVRVAELEFSRGRTREAKAVLDEALDRYCPRHAQGWALRGFMAAGLGKRREARAAFAHAIELDPGLANGWLGRGLIAMGAGDGASSLDDLQTATVQEPESAEVRSYLGKAYQVAGEPGRSLAELELAGRLDPGDPTSWLYSALVKQQLNRINEAIADLEHSATLNENRALLRSGLLLDQDQAVRSANLAAIYRDAGMLEWSVQQAARAVTYDYANYSAHLFLANSYAQRRDPLQMDLRYETPWLSELLLTQLLAPVGADVLSRQVSQHEYSRLFESERLQPRVLSMTEYLSRGAWSEEASLYGHVGRIGYAFDVSYGTDPGQQPNGDFEQRTLWPKLQVQVTPEDSVMLQMWTYDAEFGDVARYRDPADASQTQRVHESQPPNLLAGYHHAWSENSHTLMVFSRLADVLERSDSRSPGLWLWTGTNGVIRAQVSASPQFDLRYRGELAAYGGELQHILQTPTQTLLIGGRAQAGSLTTEVNSQPTSTFYTLSPDGKTQWMESDFDRLSVYAYDTVRCLEALWLTLGLSYDRLAYPVNATVVPVSHGQTVTDLVAPKAGLQWLLAKDTRLHTAYTRSLGGLAYEQSVRVEPSQVAGFTQAFRSLAPESLVGSVPGSEFESFGVGMEHRFATRTYVAAEGLLLRSGATREFGVYAGSDPFPRHLSPAATPQDLDYSELSLNLDLTQPIGRGLTASLGYQMTDTQLDQDFSALPATAEQLGAIAREGRRTALLHHLDASLLLNDPSGFFAEFNAFWYLQDSEVETHPVSSEPVPTEQFWQLNAFLGWRLAQRRAEIRLGLLNLTDQDYRLDPLSLTASLPRQRTLYLGCRLDF